MAFRERTDSCAFCPRSGIASLLSSFPLGFSKGLKRFRVRLWPRGSHVAGLVRVSLTTSAFSLKTAQGFVHTLN
jgi:hypothetical protein